MKIEKGKFNGKDVVKISIKPKIEKTTEYQPKHNVHILDRSGSMSSDIKNLIEDVKNSIKFMDDRDLLSVIWFSSHQEAKILLKGANKNTPNIEKLLDSIAYTLGTTCFSYPLELLSELIEETKILCPIFNVSLFTDGEPVVNWSVESEIEKCIKEINKNKEYIISFNTVGYGNFYNEKLLKSLSEITPMGRKFHAKVIDEYKNIWNNNYKMINNCVLYSLNISCDNADIIYINNNEYNLVKNTFTSNVLGREENVFYVICEDYKNIRINKDKIVNFDDFIIDEDFKYVLVYQYYSNNNNIEALDILGGDLKDIYLTNKLINSFTFTEKQEMKDVLKEAVIDKSKRFLEGKSTKKLIPKKNAFCIMDLLNILYKNSAWYIPLTNYTKISASKSEKVDNAIVDKDSYIGNFKTMSFNKTKLNISIDYTKNVNIVIDKSDKLNVPNNITVKGFGKHTIIKDGVLNIPKLRVAVDFNTLNEINKAVSVSFVENKVINETSYTVIDIDLSKIPIINMKLSEMDLDDYLTEFKKLNYLKNKHKKIKQDSKEKGEDIYYLFKDLNQEELEILKNKYNVSRQGWFSAPYKSTPKGQLDFYEVKELEIVCDEEVVCNVDDINLLSLITEIELNLMGCKIAKLSLGDLWKELKDLGKGKYEYNNIIFKTKKTKVYY